jgi:hypothetical protein
VVVGGLDPGVAADAGGLGAAQISDDVVEPRGGFLVQCRRSRHPVALSAAPGSSARLGRRSGPSSCPTRGWDGGLTLAIDRFYDAARMLGHTWSWAQTINVEAVDDFARLERTPVVPAHDTIC